jgi:hypothetical protein
MWRLQRCFAIQVLVIYFFSNQYTWKMLEFWGVAKNPTLTRGSSWGFNLQTLMIFLPALCRNRIKERPWWQTLFVTLWCVGVDFHSLQILEVAEEYIQSSLTPSTYPQDGAHLQFLEFFLSHFITTLKWKTSPLPNSFKMTPTLCFPFSCFLHPFPLSPRWSPRIMTTRLRSRINSQHSELNTDCILTLSF